MDTSTGSALEQILGTGRAVRIWAILSLVTLLVSLTTLRLSPPAWQDEVQILDYGRILLPGADRTSAMSWSDADRPIFPLNYPSCVASEIAFRLAGRDMAGPRLLGLLGAIAASGAMLWYLRTRGIASWIALAVSIAFLWDPMFAPGYRGARFDGWAMATMLAACGLIRRGADGERPFRPQALAGMLIGSAGAIWVSSIILLPLVVVEVFGTERRDLRPGLVAKGLLQRLGWIGAWAFVALSLCFLPYAGSLSLMLQDTLGYAHERTDSTYDLGSAILNALSTFVGSPVLAVGALLAIVWRRQWALATGLLAALGLVLATGPYVHRNVYLEPYLLIAVSVGGQAAWGSARAGPRRVAAAGMVLLCGWGAVVTLGARNANAFLDRVGRDPDRPLVELRERLGEGPHRAYLSAWRAYYAARSMGWSYLRPFSLSTDTARSLLSRCDVAIIDPGDPQEVATPEVLAEAGFRPLEDPDPNAIRLFRIYVRDPARGPANLSP